MSETLHLYVSKDEKQNVILKPSDRHSENLARDMIGKEFKAVLTRPRNIKLHKKYFALMNFIFDAQSYYTSMDHMRKAIEVELGYYEVIFTPEKELIIPKSVSFAKMDETEFEKLFNRTLDFVCRVILPNTDKEELRKEILEFLE